MHPAMAGDGQAEIDRPGKNDFALPDRGSGLGCGDDNARIQPAPLTPPSPPGDWARGWLWCSGRGLRRCGRGELFHGVEFYAALSGGRLRRTVPCAPPRCKRHSPAFPRTEGTRDAPSRHSSIEHGPQTDENTDPKPTMATIDETDSAAALIPDDPTLDRLRQAAADCTACALYRNATPTVFGEGPDHAVLMLVGEQPGDAEDLAGHPFIGGAGRLLDHCLKAAGIDRGRVYVTNAVKHFKWVPRGTRRLHSKPGALEIAACLPWLEAEIAAVRPRIIVAL